MEFGDEGQSLARLTRAVDAAREFGLAAVSANDHFLFRTPWLDGPTALAAVIERSGAMELATTVALVALRGPVPLAKTLAALDLLSDGRVIAGVGPGSSQRDYDAVGVPYEERWPRFDEAAAILRSLLRGDPPPQTRHHYPLPDRAGAGSAPARRDPALDRKLGLTGRSSARRAARRWVACLRVQHDPRGLQRGEAVAVRTASRPWQGARSIPQRARDDVDLDHRRRPRRRPRTARGSGPAAQARSRRPARSGMHRTSREVRELLSRYAQAGCERVYLWPLRDEPHQIELAATAVLPAVEA